MKKLLVKIKVIDIPYSPAVEAIPATDTEPEIPAIPEQLEVSHDEIIAQTQGNDNELAQWLAGDSFKYPEGHWIEYVDISAEVAFDQAVMAAQAEIAKGIKALAVFKARVKAKNLTTQQVATLFAMPHIAEIITILSTGSIGLAIASISAFESDGVLVTEEDKAAVIAALG
jgi:hypothetical protein